VLLVSACEQPEAEKPVVITKSTVATLSDITLSTGDLQPEFDPNITLYRVTVKNSETAITVTGTTTDKNAVLSSNNGKSKTLPVGDTVVDLTVTAEDGTSKQKYTVTVTRPDMDIVKEYTGTINDGEYAVRVNTIWDEETQILERDASCAVTRIDGKKWGVLILKNIKTDNTTMQFIVSLKSPTEIVSTDFDTILFEGSDDLIPVEGAIEFLDQDDQGQYIYTILASCSENMLTTIMKQTSLTITLEGTMKAVLNIPYDWIYYLTHYF
jgi:hypothetical protein